jgi:hypothetical protein
VLRGGEARDDLLVSAQALLDQLVPRIATLTILVEGPGSESVAVTVDEEEVPPARLGVAAPIDPGPHVLATKRDGEVLDRATVNLVEGGSFEVTLRAPAAAPSPAETAATADEVVTPEPVSTTLPDEEASSPITSRWWFWVGAGAIVVAAVVIAVAVAASASPEPIQGDLDPPVLRGMP